MVGVKNTPRGNELGPRLNIKNVFSCQEISIMKMRR